MPPQTPDVPPKTTPLGLTAPPGRPAHTGTRCPAAAPSSPASAGLTGLEPVRFFTGTVGTLQGASRDHVRAGGRHPHPRSPGGRQGPDNSCLSNCTGPGWKQRIPQQGDMPPLPHCRLFSCSLETPPASPFTAPFCHRSPGWSVVLFFLFSPTATSLPQLFPPLPLGLSSMGKFPGRSGAEGRGRMEKERKGARLQQKADSRARQRGETGSLNTHPLEKKVSLEGGGLEAPLLMGPEWLFFGPFAVPHPSPATKRKSSLSLLIEMQEPPHPCSTPQAPAGKERGPAEPFAHGRLGTANVHLPPGPGVIAALQGGAPQGCSPSVPWGGEKKLHCTCSPPQLPSRSHTAGLTQRQ